MCKHSTRVPFRERADNMRSAYEHGASPKAQGQASSQSGHCSRRGSDPRMTKPQLGQQQVLQQQQHCQQQQQFARQGKKQGQRFNKMDQQNNNTVVVENTRHLKRHSTVQRASPSKHLHMLNNNSSSYGDRGTKNTSPIPSSLSRSSPVSIPGAAAAKSQGQPAYAGAKFSDPPSPTVLPKPPTHWVAPQADGKGSSCAEMTSVLKVMLKVQA